MRRNNDTANSTRFSLLKKGVDVSSFQVIFQTQEKVFPRTSKDLEESSEYDAQRSIFDEMRGVWIADGTLSQVFDISSQSKGKLRRKRRSK